jgi:hypothetical protein
VNQPTSLGELTATGTGECRDKNGNLLDSEGFFVETQQDKDEN